MTNSPPGTEPEPVAQGMGRLASSPWRQRTILLAGAVAEALARTWGPDVPDPRTRRRGGVGFVREQVVDERRGRRLTTYVFHPADTDADDPEEGAPPADGPPRPLVVFAHGGRATPMLYAHLLGLLVRRGFVVVAPILPEAAGRHARGADGPQVLTQVADLHLVARWGLRAAETDGHPIAGRVAGRRIGLVGHSLGATTAIAAIGRGNGSHDVAAVAAIAPRLFPLGGDHRYDVGTCPLLLVHGHRDRVVPVGASAATYLDARGPRYLVGVPAGHHFEFLRPSHPASRPIGGAVADFLDGYVAGTPAARGELERRLDAGHLTVRADATVTDLSHPPSIAPVEA
jgi:alpha-beta hydrolase superfamily lysophospholipase